LTRSAIFQRNSAISEWFCMRFLQLYSRSVLEAVGFIIFAVEDNSILAGRYSYDAAGVETRAYRWILTRKPDIRRGQSEHVNGCGIRDKRWTMNPDIAQALCWQLWRIT
jgi:hypothetical protein